MYVDQNELKEALKNLDQGALNKMQSAMSGQDHENGQLEDLNAGLSRAHEVIAKLIFMMLSKAILTRQEAVAIVAEYGCEKNFDKGEER